MSPDLAAALANAGGLTVALFFVLVAAVGAYRRWWVPGWIYDQERSDRTKAEVAAQRNGELLERLTDAFEELADDHPAVRRRFDVHP